MTVNVLGNGVHHNISTVNQRVLNIGAHESVINNNQDTMAVSDVSDSTDVNKAESGVRGRLDPNELSLRTNQTLKVLFNGGRESDLNTVGRGNLGEIAVGATVHVGDRDDV